MLEILNRLLDQFTKLNKPVTMKQTLFKALKNLVRLEKDSLELLMAAAAHQIMMNSSHNCQHILLILIFS